jgi:predicted nuclease of predicted toxin-antitoxin system
MRFLADENFPLPSVRVLRQSGHDVVSISEDSPGARDHEVLRRANEENRILLTLDRDFGELIFRHGLPSPLGVVYLRFPRTSPAEPGHRLLEVLSDPALSLERHLTVVQARHVRRRPLGTRSRPS